MVRRLLPGVLLLALALGACAARDDTEARIAAIRARCAAGYTARVDVETAAGERYALDASRADGEARVTVREPEALAGVSAVLRGDALALEFDGALLDAGCVDGDVCAMNAADVALCAAAEGAVIERGREPCGEVPDALRLCFETERAGQTLRCALWFDASDAPLYAEIERGGEILAYLQFTDAAFCDKIP